MMILMFCYQEKDDQSKYTMTKEDASKVSLVIRNGIKMTMSHSGNELYANNARLCSFASSGHVVVDLNGKL